MLYPCWILRGAGSQDFISGFILFTGLGPAKSQRQHLACLRLYTPRETAQILLLLLLPLPLLLFLPLSQLLFLLLPPLLLPPPPPLYLSLPYRCHR